ncbi:outer membrane protein assembly factor BamB [Shewanella yunxiaonensis]|uniref:Outer membrane protein assembly factor BamB n=1 Tax=Shewanella yunxiaonensis TaxID=2829809 RepID=A0ABX7YQS2_9GAMM|nr:outer membrane protein assembly factor BamB [Shewanella yunxiaonensis]QUN04745.1 outer membrane protein assembly factor BamB [Shewanella yunxiaonensis]
MMSWCKTLIACGLVVGALAGCASSDVDEAPVSPLPDITPTVHPDVVWDDSVGDGVGDYYSRLHPAIRYGKIFVASRDGKVAAFDEKSGDELWKVDFNDLFGDGPLKETKGARLAAGITVAQNKVFVGGESGLLVALDVETGKPIWHSLASGELLSAPTVAEDTVVVNCSTGALDAFNVDTGAKLWTYESTLPNLTLRGTGSAAYAEGGFFVGTADGKVAVVVKTSGQAAWEQPIYVPKGGNEFSRMADVDMTPLLIGSNIYAVSYNGNLVSMELRSGRVVWSRKYSSFHELAESGVDLYLVDDHSNVYAVDRRNGLELWSNSELANRQLTSPAVYRGYVVVGDFEGYLHFIDRESGKIVGRVKVDGSGLFSQPQVADDKIYVQTRDGKVAAISLP